ncbi:hypothetical protein, partial [Frankia sp. AvcI1]
GRAVETVIKRGYRLAIA